MDRASLWKIGLGVALTGAICYIRSMKRKNVSFVDRTTAFPDDDKWLKVGEVKELLFYPLKSGRGKSAKVCKFTEHGISILPNDEFTLRDRMFLIYNEENGKFVTGKAYRTLVLVTLSAVNKTTVRLEATGMQSLDFEPAKLKSKIVDCSMWFDEPLKCQDCGDAVAEWISQFLTGKKSGLRLGFTIYHQRKLDEEPWKKYTKVYKTLSNNDTGLFADLASYMLMSEASLDELNKKLKRPVTSLQFRPNIVVSGTDPFAEDNWEWIKIGSNVVLRNVKPCPRCVVTRIDPETGNVDDEPLTCLREFRAQNDPERISIDGISPIFGVYCGLYSSGNVAVGDDVFVPV